MKARTPTSTVTRIITMTLALMASAAMLLKSDGDVCGKDDHENDGGNKDTSENDDDDGQRM